MIVEKSSFDVDPNAKEDGTRGNTLPAGSVSVQGSRGRGLGGRGRGRGRGRGSKGKRRGAAYGVSRGQKRGTHDGAHDILPPVSEPEEIHVEDDAPAEGLYTYIQTNVCRRAVLTKIFQNASHGQ